MSGVSQRPTTRLRSVASTIRSRTGLTFRILFLLSTLHTLARTNPEEFTTRQPPRTSTPQRSSKQSAARHAARVDGLDAKALRPGAWVDQALDAEEHAVGVVPPGDEPTRPR